MDSEIIIPYMYKTTLLACIAASIWLIILSAKLSRDVIESCEDACSGAETSMSSVTSMKCICSKSSVDDGRGEWVLPNR